MDFTQTQAHTIVGGQVGFAVPLIVSVTGRRNLVADEILAVILAIRMSSMLIRSAPTTTA